MYIFVLDIFCQHLGHKSQLNIYVGIGYIMSTLGGLKGFCAPFGRRVGICTFSHLAPEGRTETLQLTLIPQVLAWYIQYQHIYSTDIYSPNVGRIYPIQIYNFFIYIPQPCARRALRNPPTYIHPPSFGIINSIPIWKYHWHLFLNQIGREI